MQVSVPGIKKKPAPYSEQILTYSTALALSGRSAACAPPTARRPAAEPRMRLLIVFIYVSKFVGRFHPQNPNLPRVIDGRPRTFRGLATMPVQLICVKQFIHSCNVLWTHVIFAQQDLLGHLYETRLIDLLT